MRRINISGGLILVELNEDELAAIEIMSKAGGLRAWAAIAQAIRPPEALECDRGGSK